MSNEHTRTNIIRLRDHFKTLQLSKNIKAQLMSMLTDNGKDPNMENTILDIGEVPMDEGAFNSWLLGLIKTTRLIVVDESYDRVYETGKVKVHDPKTGTVEEVEFDRIPYPEEIKDRLEEFDLTREQFLDEFEPYTAVSKNYKYVEVNGETVIEETEEVGTYYLRKIKKKVTVRQEVIDLATFTRDGELDAIALSDFCENKPNQFEGYIPPFDETALRNVLQYISERHAQGHTEVIMFKLGKLRIEEETSINIAKLFLLANELIEMSDISSGQLIVMESVCAVMMQMLIDFSTYEDFLEDFQTQFESGSTFLYYEGASYRRMKLAEIETKTGETGTPVASIICYDVTPGKEDWEEHTINLYDVFALRAIILPIGISQGNGEGLGDDTHRRRFFNKTSFKKFNKKTKVSGISPYIKDEYDFNSSTNYTTIFIKAMKEIYDEEGWGDLPELDLLEIIKGAPSPFQGKSLGKTKR